MGRTSASMLVCWYSASRAGMSQGHLSTSYVGLFVCLGRQISHEIERIHTHINVHQLASSTRQPFLSRLAAPCAASP